ncbi:MULTISPECIES: leucyl aminopeptidase [Actinopolyspora]|uniref:Probable cytosol aminopeptidase n=1 Tax=Actinopolyspora saharensis TaxID=995062 RepID=A0A1H1H153_9ACTN|nr:leucyl aminopeptidase [Actinopolyspora saharensis]NHD17937.1 leucyl aminopeptidase [Actinopolyspora sp. BKK2]NHE77810.1 leucyl aminopeptidase [Actinopolyspora sp. BKK1]SDR19154.1 leucyl aminopeptidase [Actinopolyspora saharensis]
MSGSATSTSSTAAILPVIPTALVEVDVVERWRDGIPAAVPIRDVDGEPELGTSCEVFGVDAGVLRALEVTGKAGEVRTVPLPEARFGWTVGSGDGSSANWRAVGAALARAARARLEDAGADGGDPEDLGEALDVEYLQVRLPAEADEELVAALTLGLALGDYRFRVTSQPTPPRLRKVLLVAEAEEDAQRLRPAASRAREWASATALARDLANTPSNVKDPAWLASTAAGLAESVPGLRTTVRDEKWLAEHGFGGVLAVGGGSTRPPRLLEMHWDGTGDSAARHTVVVGKGITFDTGGISLKPADGMEMMRTDMAGGGAVIGAMLAVARLELPVRVTALVPMAENHVSGSAYRPGDVVRHYDGTTTEVVNTDAEGRMAMADALGYAVREHDPDMLVDVATLTGAMKVALGLRTGGVFSSEQSFGERVRAAGERAGERWWPMPLPEDHVEDVRGANADVRQAPQGPGGVMAALFLREFTGGLPWAHLDIAGPGRAEKNYEEVVPGATGFAARTLVELMAGLAE